MKIKSFVVGIFISAAVSEGASAYTFDEAMQMCQAKIPVVRQQFPTPPWNWHPGEGECITNSAPNGSGAIILYTPSDLTFSWSFESSATIALSWVQPAQNPADGAIPTGALGAMIPSKIRGTNNVHYSTATLKATVKSSTGSPVAGAAVQISVDVIPLTGYHNHTSAIRPKGILSSPTIPTSNQSIQIPGTTDANGEFKFFFTATDFSGNHKIAASCTDRTCTQQGPSVVVARIPNLASLAENAQLYTLRGASSTHQSNHNFTSVAQAALIDLATRFRDQNNGTLLILNDGSLPLGGLYDFTNNWANPHKAHRRGVVVDINNFTVRNIPFEHLCKDLGIFPSWEGGSHPHYHLWLIGQDG